MASFEEFLSRFDYVVPFARSLLVIVLVYLVFDFILRKIRKSLLSHARNKTQVTNVTVFSRILKYVIVILILLFGVFSFTGSWAGLGIGIGLISAGLGLALQRPITGLAGWLMVITKRPFEIGDRVIIGDTKGDVIDMTPTHLYLSEVGGAIQGENVSGRIILLPNSKLFEHNIINYTYQDDFILGMVEVTVTYESNLKKAIEIARIAANARTAQYDLPEGKEAFIRSAFQSSGIDLKVFFWVPAKAIFKAKSDVTEEIYERFRKSKIVEFAYPHTEVLLRKKKQRTTKKK